MIDYTKLHLNKIINELYDYEEEREAEEWAEDAERAKEQSYEDMIKF